MAPILANNLDKRVGEGGGLNILFFEILGLNILICLFLILPSRFVLEIFFYSFPIENGARVPCWLVLPTG